MTDIVQRLRLVDPDQVLLGPPPNDTSYLQVGVICHEAAAEIERLRAAVTAEREACAKIADKRQYKCVAAAIRARGEQP